MLDKMLEGKMIRSLVYEVVNTLLLNLKMVALVNNIIIQKNRGVEAN